MAPSLLCAPFADCGDDRTEKTVPNSEKMKLTVLFRAFLLLAALAALLPVQAKDRRLLYLPLDERFTTRDLFLAYARITPYRVVTPDRSMLPRQKIPPDMGAMLAWTERWAKEADAAIISADMLLYGGLIASRTSTETIERIRPRLQLLARLKQLNPRLIVYVSTTVMRMPSYSSSEEEPDYYALYGRQIFLFSQHLHRYELLGDPRDRELAEKYRKQIPDEVLADYLQRRQRNLSFNRELIALVERGAIDRLSITLDDNAEFGLFKKEATELARLAHPLGSRVLIYPGADEAQLALLAKLIARDQSARIRVVYRFPQASKLIPAFEGQPLDESVRQQVAASGGTIVEGEADAILFINNFPDRQTFAGAQPQVSTASVKPLEAWLASRNAMPSSRAILILADNKYYNGADVELVTALLQSRFPSERIAYAGWNTSGNTLGSAIALGILRLHMPPTRLPEYKRILWARLMEDWVYMVEGREQIKRDMERRGLRSFAGTPLEREYEQRMEQLFNQHAPIINRYLETDFFVTRVFFPWHRPFEIGFEIGAR
ncbi:MAG: hypothetical protein C4334_08050 [Pyrinomonas sp.]